MITDQDATALREFVAVLERFHADLAAWAERHPDLMDPAVLAELRGVGADTQVIRTLLDRGVVPDVGKHRRRLTH